MEKTGKQTEINLRNKEVRILLAGHYDIIHAGHTQLITDAKNSFKRVHLILGIINDNPNSSVLALHEKIESFKNNPEIDEICVLSGPVQQEDMAKVNADYLATANPEASSLCEKVLLMQKKIDISTDNVIARIVKDYDSHLEDLLSSGISRSQLKISRAKEMSVICKMKLKKIKDKLWRKGYSVANLEKSLDSTRKYVRETFSDWNEYHERLVRKWLTKARVSTNKFYNLLCHIWD